MINRKTTIINFFGGPCCGKTTASMLVASKLRMRGISAEWIPEYAKSLSWRQDFGTLDNQVLVTAMQWQRQRDLCGKVDFIVTDAPILQGLVYDKLNLKGFDQLVADIHGRSESINILLRRRDDHECDNNGRHHTYPEAVLLDMKIEQILISNEVHYAAITAHDIQAIVEYVFSILEVK